MEGKDVIIEKILSDARQEADKIVAEANDYATATLDKAKAQAKAKVSVAEKAAETAGVEYVGRRITVAGLDLKKAKLNAKSRFWTTFTTKRRTRSETSPTRITKTLSKVCSILLPRTATSSRFQKTTPKF